MLYGSASASDFMGRNPYPTAFVVPDSVWESSILSGCAGCVLRLTVLSGHASFDLETINNASNNFLTFSHISSPLLTSPLAYGQRSWFSYSVSLSPIPEPGTLSLVGIGIAALGRRMARRSRKHRGAFVRTVA